MTTALFADEVCKHAVQEWSTLTGHDPGSQAWAEVCKVLLDSGVLSQVLLEPGLFEQTEDRRVYAEALTRLRYTLVGGALLQQINDQVDLPTTTAMAAALIESFHGPTFGQPLEAWAGEMSRRTEALCDSPAGALQYIVQKYEPGQWRSILTPNVQAADTERMVSLVVLNTALSSDDVAIDVFGQLADLPGYRLRLIRLCTEQYLIYHCNA